jgi:predicted metal-dependent enzyme (double-stranded beta helix superfamily)
VSPDLQASIYASLRYCTHGRDEVTHEAIESASAVIESITLDIRSVVESSAPAAASSAAYDIVKGLNLTLAEPLTQLTVAHGDEVPLCIEPVRELLHADESLSIVAITFPHGASTPAHDHYSDCVSLQLLGRASEAMYSRSTYGGWDVCAVAISPGDASLTPRNDIHAVRNPSDHISLSLHVYFYDYRVLGGMRNVYQDAPVAPFRASPD